MVLDFFFLENGRGYYTNYFYEVNARVSEQAKQVDALLCKGKKERFLNQLLYIN